jgi:hypothetical protein
MHDSSLFLIFGSALFMILVSILFFLRMGGIHIQIHIPELVLATSSINASAPPFSPYRYVFGGLAVGFLATYIAYKLGYV